MNGIPSIDEIVKCVGVTTLGDIPAVVGTADIEKFVACILKHYGNCGTKE